MKIPKTIKDRLKYLRGEIEAECISYGEIAELESLKEYIDEEDVLLKEWAGIPEFPENKNYSVTLTLSIEAENKDEAFIEFRNKVKLDDYDHDNLEIELEEEEE